MVHQDQAGLVSTQLFDADETIGKPCPPEIPEGCHQKDEAENEVLSERFFMYGMRKRKSFFVGHLCRLYLQGESPLFFALI